MRRAGYVLIGVISLVAWLGALLLVARYSESGTSRVSASLIDPPPGQPLNPDSARKAELRWDIQGAHDCSVSLQGEETFEVPDDGIVSIELPEHTMRTALLTLRCEERVIGRYARPLALDKTGDAVGSATTDQVTAGERIEVSRVHVDADELESALSEQLPAQLNPILARELRALAPVVAAESRSWPVPGWLVDGVQLKPTSSVVVRSARLDLDETRFSIALDVDVDLDLAILNRPIIAPSRRGTRTIDFSVQDRFRPVRATLSLDDWPTLRVHGVRLEGRFCRRFDRDIVRNICDRAASRVYERLESVIEEQVRSAAGGLIRSLDLESLLTEAVRRWADSMDLEGLVNELVADADFRLDRTVQDERGLHASLTTTRQWLTRDGTIHLVESPQELEVADSAATVDFAVRVSVINRLLDALFDKPLIDVVDTLGAAGDRYGTGSGLRQLEKFLEDGSATDLSEADDRLFVLLRLASLRVHAAAQASPWLAIGAGDKLSFDTGAVDLFESASGSTRLSVQSVAGFAFTERGDWVVLTGPEGGLSPTLALEARAASEPLASDKSTRRAEAAVRVFYRSLRAPQTGSSENTSPGTLSEWLESAASVPLFPTSYAMGAWQLEVSSLSLRHTNQSVEMQLEMLTDRSE